MTDDLAQIATLTETDPCATPLSAITLITYLDGDGEECMGMATHGDSTVTSRVGLLTWATYRLLTDPEDT